jgi:hypothetical protein
MNEVFANCSGKDEIYPLTTVEIAEAQRADASLKHLFKCNAVIDQGLEIKLIENTACVCKDGWLVIPKPLQVRAVKWYHCYLKHPRHTCLKETMNAAMYLKGMCTTICSLKSPSDLARQMRDQYLKGQQGKTPASPRSQSATVAPPSGWWKFWTSMSKQIFQP